MAAVTVVGAGKLALAVGGVFDRAEADAPVTVLAHDRGADTIEGLPACAREGVVLCLAPLTPQEAAAYARACAAAGAAPLCGAVLGRYADLGTPSSFACFSGDRAAFDAARPAIDLLGPAEYLGENPAFAPLMAFTAVGTHYSSVLALYAGVGMCRKYGYELGEYIDHMASSVGPLSQGAYRNIWAGLACPDTFEDVDDVIHGMEMLVCLLKKTGGAALIEHDGERQAVLNALLERHWHALAAASAESEVSHV